MVPYLTGRVLSTLPVLVGITAFVFLMLHLVPGDPVLLLVGEGGVASPQALNALRHELGLTDPLPVQFARYSAQMIRGNWGRSIRFNRPVLELLAENARYTIELALAALIAAVAWGSSPLCTGTGGETAWRCLSRWWGSPSPAFGSGRC
jgi:ABC-type dipeptide/oligopeptide/nickel transport system permease component